jgi:spermidine synthase
MIPRVLIGSAAIPDTDKELKLYQSGDVFSIKIPGRGELMNSRTHGSEKALAELACEHLGGQRQPRLLVGGLGMGFTLAAALGAVGPGAEVVVAELVPEVVSWNRSLMGEPAGHPLRDPRTQVYVGDVGELIRRETCGFDATDGRRQRTRSAGSSRQRLALRPRRARHALRCASGVLAVRSATPDPFASGCNRRLRHARARRARAPRRQGRATASGSRRRSEARGRACPALFHDGFFGDLGFR